MRSRLNLNLNKRQCLIYSLLAFGEVLGVILILGATKISGLVSETRLIFIQGFGIFVVVLSPLFTIHQREKVLEKTKKDREAAMDQLTLNLTQFDKTADRLRNPLGVIISSVETVNELGYDRVLETVDKETKRIMDELEELRAEEWKTYNLTKK